MQQLCMVRECTNVLKASACIFLLAQVSHHASQLLNSQVSTGLLLISFIAAMIYLVQEDNHVWAERSWSQLSSYILIILVCHRMYSLSVGLFYEEVRSVSWWTVIPSRVKIVQVKRNRSLWWFICFFIFEYFTVVYVLVSFIAVVKVTQMYQTDLDGIYCMYTLREIARERIHQSGKISPVMNYFLTPSLQQFCFLFKLHTRLHT
ncbi:unnamed protein product [Allacma fusca]|uniref:Uncharacterized protein n=1 Tax=Allacma fusca TaxID=39272 RepID=A0A8J2Q069_9HEXA|nr:unnamed protein product [Allacma fusca]